MTNRTQQTTESFSAWPTAAVSSAYEAWLGGRPDTPEAWRAFMAGALAGWLACCVEMCGKVIRASWRREGEGYRGVLVDPAGQIVWRCPALATLPRYAMEDARRGGCHWSTDGRGNGFTQAMAKKAL